MTEGLHCYSQYTASDVSSSSDSAYPPEGMNGLADGECLQGEDWDDGKGHQPDDDYDPLKLYLNEVGSFSLLERSSEIATAKRIDNGRNTIVRAVYSLPSSVEQLLRSAESVKTGELLLADLVRSSNNLESTLHDEERRFFSVIRQIKALHQQRSVIAERRNGRHAASGNGVAKPVDRSGQSRAKREDLIISLRLKPEVVEGVVKELEAAVQRVKAARNGSTVYILEKKRFERAVGANLARVCEILRIIEEARHDIDQARSAMINANLRLVVRMARKYAFIGRLSMSDLIQEGNIGLMRAVDLFDFSKGYRFSTYATCWIKQAMIRALANKSRTIRLPVHVADDTSRILRNAHDLADELGEKPAPEDIAARIKMPPEKVMQLLDISREPLSLSMTFGEDDAQFEDFLEDTSIPSPLETAIRSDLQTKISNAMSALDPKEEKILRGRFGFGEEQQTLATLAREFGLTRERIRQIEVKALRKIQMQFSGTPS